MVTPLVHPLTALFDFLQLQTVLIFALLSGTLWLCISSRLKRDVISYDFAVEQVVQVVPAFLSITELDL